jgi:hypothetical protein
VETGSHGTAHTTKPFRGLGASREKHSDKRSGYSDKPAASVLAALLGARYQLLTRALRVGRQPFPSHQCRVATEPYPSFFAAALNATSFIPSRSRRLPYGLAWRPGFQAHSRERIGGRHMLFLRALANEPGTPASRHRSICGAAALAFVPTIALLRLNRGAIPLPQMHDIPRHCMMRLRFWSAMCAR